MQASPQREPAKLVEHFFRHETGRLHGTLLRLVGTHNLQLAEDVAQEAMLRALRNWSMGGVPDNPAAWITRVAMNLARDALRHKRVVEKKEEDIAHHQRISLPGLAIASEGAKTVRDDVLRLLFVCCHPRIKQDAQVILALKIICGFSVGEIAQAFFSTPAAIEKQLTRTKKRIQESNIPFEIPEGESLDQRLNGVLGALYLLFNEGYKASAGDTLVRFDLCHEAIRLTDILLRHPIGEHPAAHALMALMLLNASRLKTRTDAGGALLRLEEQDRALWDAALIKRGLTELGKAAAGEALTEYHLQAGIAALHCSATDYASTDWDSIIRHYDALHRLTGSSIVLLNRAVAVSQRDDAQTGLAAIKEIPDIAQLQSNHLFHAVQGELYLKIGDKHSAALCLRQARDLATVEAERIHLERLLQQAIA